ncbi:hypothetical protein MICAH_1790004 [Microcystis aeruginosa PCC 9809]|uniref:Uncharacterized protein n=2 Tax=Microcystis aeruginosa TaxID=1126 RepID=I4HJZ3_MICAE|nr:hypothetical protein MICAB_3380002 [Microcystis aeruginosa PCC 9717]CCI22367.1 hypothetical protein MICAH_1790004 [Microcystis aeruginosa PCC 9809]
MCRMLFNPVIHYTATILGIAYPPKIQYIELNCCTSKSNIRFHLFPVPSSNPEL